MVSYTSFAFFILYFGITFILYTLIAKPYKWCVLLAGSWIFYFISSKGHILPLIAATLLVWGAALGIQRLSDDFKKKKKGMARDERKALKKKYNKYKSLVLTGGIIGTVALLLVCKYAGFFTETVNGLFRSALPEPRVVQPLGISFYTLQAVSYLVDVYNGKYEARKNPLRVSLYLSFMLTIVEGPFARYDNLGFELEQCASFDAHRFERGVQRIIWGLIKKIIIADRAAEFVNAVFDYSDRYRGVVVIFGILFYTLQLYCEFSGVMDVMCGLGDMLGISVPENFARPFFAKSINDFWTRWHMTLGAWLRDYIFYPISFSKPFMNAVKSARKRFSQYYANLIPTAVALFFVWFTNGFWHGSGWKYIVYGLYYYVLMMVGMFLEPLFAKISEKIHLDREKSKVFALFRMVRTFAIVNVGMLIFRADTLQQAAAMLKSVFAGLNLSALLPGSGNGFGLDLLDYGIIVFGTLLVFVVGVLGELKIDIREKITTLPFAVRFIGYLAAILIVVMAGAYGEGYGIVDLIYANF